MYKFTQQENQRKFILPYNDISKTLFYNQRMAVSPPLETPVAWHISKVEGINPLGVIHYTLAQNAWNQNTDVVEYDDDGNVTGMWCDLLKESNLPSVEQIMPEPELHGNYAELTYAGAKPHIKVGGSYKKIILTYYNSNEVLKDQAPGEWSYTIDGTDATELIQILETDSPNIIKIKFLGDEEYVGKTLNIKNTKDDIIAELQLQIVNL